MSSTRPVTRHSVTPDMLKWRESVEPHESLRGLAERCLASDSWQSHGLVLLVDVPVDGVQDAALSAASLSRAFGELLPQDGAGTLVREVRYRGVGTGEGTTGRYSDSNEGGQLHTDGPHRPGSPPDVFALLCVRQATEGGALVVMRSSDVFRRLPPPVVDELRRRFTFDQRQAGQPPIERPVLTLDGDGTPRLRYLRAYIDKGEEAAGRALSGNRKEALDMLDEAIEQGQAEDGVELVLQPGQMVLVDNRRVLHGRTTFGVDGPGADRLMLRTWIGLPP